MSYVIREGKRYYKDDRTEMLSLDTATQEEADRREQRNNNYYEYIDNTNHRKRIALVLVLSLVVIFGIANFIMFIMNQKRNSLFHSIWLSMKKKQMRMRQ